jgi:hypothetical protein
LLGLVRDGDLLSHDRDIDIGVWAHDRDRLVKLVQSICTANYRILATRYCGRLYKVKLVPRSQKLRKIDISIYEVAKGHAWSLAVIPRGMFGRRQVLATIRHQWWAPRRNTRMLLHAFLRRFRGFLSECDMACYPWTTVYKVWTWWIPVNLLEKRVFENRLLVWIPMCADRYLTYRYGDWQIPVKNWVYFRDDKALIHDKPETVIKVHAQGDYLSEEYL